MQRGAFRELEELRHLPVRKRLHEMGPDRPETPGKSECRLETRAFKGRQAARGSPRREIMLRCSS